MSQIQLFDDFVALAHTFVDLAFFVHISVDPALLVYMFGLASVDAQALVASDIPVGFDTTVRNYVDLKFPEDAFDDYHK